MKVRITMLTENNIPRSDKMTEDQVKKAWQIVMDMLAIASENGDKCVVESAEFVEE